MCVRAYVCGSSSRGGAVAAGACVAVAAGEAETASGRGSISRGGRAGRRAVATGGVAAGAISAGRAVAAGVEWGEGAVVAGGVADDSSSRSCMSVGGSVPARGGCIHA